MQSLFEEILTVTTLGTQKSADLESLAIYLPRHTGRQWDDLDNKQMHKRLTILRFRTSQLLQCGV